MSTMLSSTLEPNVPRHKWMKKLIALLRVLQPTYYVKRGAIVWQTFTWPNERAIAVRAAENFPPDERGLRQTTLELIVAAKVQQDKQEADDELLDSLEDDMVNTVKALRALKDTDGTSGLIVSAELLGSVEFNGISEALDHGFQGWFITFKVEY